MGTQTEVEFAYNDIDEMWRLSLGEHADITAAYYNGDYGKSLEQAQHDKHEWILEGLDFEPGDRLIDIGCGWGPILKAVKERSGEGVGLTLSRKQLETCRRHDLNAILKDWKELRPGELGTFDALVSVGAFEHFCTIEEYLGGEMDAIYGDFFRTCHDLLADGGKMFLQTMTWGKYLPWNGHDPTAEDLERCTLNAPYMSDERVLALFGAFFPGAWLPRNLEHIQKLADPYFEMATASDGRLDYVQTVTEWEKAWYAPGPGKLMARIRALRGYILGGSAYREKMQCIKENAIREVFVRDLFGHQRIFFRRR